MSYYWGVDGYGREFISHSTLDRNIIMCALPGFALVCIFVLEDQEQGGCLMYNPFDDNNIQLWSDNPLLKAVWNSDTQELIMIKGGVPDETHHGVKSLTEADNLFDQWVDEES